jgi:hypothetical protein
MGRVLCSSNGWQYREKDADPDSCSVASPPSNCEQTSVRLIDRLSPLIGHALKLHLGFSCVAAVLIDRVN